MFVTGLRGQQFVQQRIDHRVGDTGVVLAAVDRGLTGVKVLPLLKTWAQRLLQGHEDHVEVEAVQALLVLCTVNGAKADIDAQTAQVLDVGLQDALKVGVDQQYLEAQRLFVRVEQPLIGKRPACVGQQFQGFAQGIARDAAAIGLRWCKRLVNRLGGN